MKMTKIVDELVKKRSLFVMKAVSFVERGDEILVALLIQLRFSFLNLREIHQKSVNIYIHHPKSIFTS